MREQIRVASGEALRTTQEDLVPRGVAVECRVNAEDPGRDFAPAPGTLEEFVPPGGPFVRVDTHGRAGWKVPPQYDSLLAKVICWAPERGEALDRMDRALAEFRIAGPGVHTTIPLLRDIIADPVFRAGKHITSFLDTRE
ncbi:hypothetical protein ACWV95_09800 [Streptomyces albus]